MTNRIKKDDLVRRLAARMNTDEATAATWIDGIVETLYDSFKVGESVTLPGLGGFYIRPEPESWVFKFNPGQRLRAFSAGHLHTQANSKPYSSTRVYRGNQPDI